MYTTVDTDTSHIPRKCSQTNACWNWMELQPMSILLKWVTTGCIKLCYCYPPKIIYKFTMTCSHHIDFCRLLSINQFSLPVHITLNDSGMFSEWSVWCGSGRGQDRQADRQLQQPPDRKQLTCKTNILFLIHQCSIIPLSFQALHVPSGGHKPCFENPWASQFCKN